MVENLKVLVLVIEDDKYMNETLCELLNAFQCEVYSAYTGSDAINKIRNNGKQYNLLILDYFLVYDKEITGLDVYKAAKEKNGNIKAILLSGYLNRQVKKEAMNIGINLILEKPFLVNDLMDSVNYLMKDIISERQQK